MAAGAGTNGVGLYRTEFFFLTHPSVPDEAEQLANYRAVVEATPSGSITIRTLDVGADKRLPYLDQPDQANPLLGWRGIRVGAGLSRTTPHATPSHLPSCGQHRAGTPVVSHDQHAGGSSPR